MSGLTNCKSLPDKTWVPWEGPQPKKPWFKIYSDGGHYVGTLISRGKVLNKKKKHAITAMDELFDSLYFNACSDGLKGEEMKEYIKNGILKLFPYEAGLDGYIAKKIERKIINLYKRIKRFRRKTNLNRWNYFVTITYNSILHTEETFRMKLRKCLSNLHVRRGWKYMGVFERAPETGRLHFHGILYVPDGELIGRITEKRDYDTRNGRVQITFENSFFAENFGRNDFKELNQMELRNGYCLRYLTKYIGKTNERITYSRGVPTVIYKQIDNSDIATEFIDFVTKYVLFDNVIDWERDICRKARKQVTIVDLLCNPPN